MIGLCLKYEQINYGSKLQALATLRIMEKLGGGGHLTVSGAQLKDCTTEEAKERVRTAIVEYLEEEA